MTKLILYLVAGAIIELAVIEGIVWSVEASHHSPPDNLFVAVTGLIIYALWSLAVVYGHYSEKVRNNQHGRI
jgi:hypothetical protein